MNKVIGVILILLAIALGYSGVNAVIESTASASFLGIEIGVSDSSQKVTGFVFIGAAVVALIGGVALLRKK